MSFNVLNFNCTRNSASPSCTANNNTQNFYTSSSDSLATILAPSYFPAYFGFAPNVAPQNNDFVMIKGTDGSANSIITNTGAGTVSELTVSSPLVSSTITTQSVSFSGPWASSQPGTLQMKRDVYANGYIETTLNIPAILVNATTASRITMSPIPTYYPSFPGGSAISFFFIGTQDNNTQSSSFIFFDNSFFQIDHFYSGLATSGTSGFFPTSITYPSN
jgi:hypothetical protein